MSLDDYKQKRNFQNTPEPQAGAHGPIPAGQEFVIHRHEARNLHYDLRLENAGALMSWAVPKGFSFDPSDKRLAVRTEDHPMEYLEFEGVIPKGEYGAGTMQVWDRGTFELVVETDWQAALDKGEVKVILNGRKLRGEWHLVRTKQGPNTWLLFKSKDTYAGTSRDTVLGVPLTDAPRRALPQSVNLATCEPPREPFSDPNWLFEMRFAGRRLLAEKRGAKAKLRDLDALPKDLDFALRNLMAQDALIDGVLVAPDAHGRPDSELLEQRLAAGELDSLQFYAFDLLYFDEFDLRPMRQIDRKAALRAILRPSSALLFVDHVMGEGESLAATVAEAGLPGVIAKASGAAYGESWIHVATEAIEGAGERDLESALAVEAEERSTARVKFSNLDKVYWPAEGFTKRDLCNYYDRVAGLLLPHLKDRPVHMLRYPDGIDGKSFYQRQAPEHLPDWFQRMEFGEDDVHMVIDGRDALMHLVNLGSIDLHPWMSRRDAPDSPDYAVIDLDPKDAPFRNVIRIARITGRLLRGIGVEPVLKTSGKSGIHICVPLNAGYSFDQSRMFAEAVARAVCAEAPDIATVERAVGSRAGKVYVDFMQNRRGQTVVPPFVPRPVPGATVSTPLFWDELESDLHPSQFNIQTVLSRFDSHGDLFHSVLDNTYDLLPVIENLQSYMGRGRE